MLEISLLSFKFLTGLAEASYEQVAENAEEGVQPETYCLSSYFQYIVERLLETTDRPDAGQVRNQGGM